MTLEVMKYDVVIVGAGPAGLAAAINLKKLSKHKNKETSVCIVEKGSEVGAHILSGAILETRALDELVNDWRDRDNPIKTKVNNENLIFLTEKKSYKIPKFFTPSVMHNNNNYIISLGNFCKWLSEIAESMGVEIYPGFSASDVLIDEKKRVYGIKTGSVGILRDGSKGENFQEGVEIHSKYVLFAEGCRGHLGKKLVQNFALNKESQHQTYGIGIKELWEVGENQSKPGQVLHTIGWPLSEDVYGGSFLYHLKKNLISIGFVIGLDYKNPYLSPYDEFQKFKTHPYIRNILKNGKRVSYGARALNEGGWQSIPRLVFPGGALLGCNAGTLNTPKIKGTHTAMKSGMIAAESVFQALQDGREKDTLTSYNENFLHSWAGVELKKARNVRPSFKWGLKIGMILTGIDQILLRGNAPWTLSHHKTDHESTVQKNFAKKIEYPKPDGIYTFDKLTSVSFTSTYHEENQPCHLTLRDSKVPIEHNFKYYDSPEQRYCPAGVYEIVNNENSELSLQINAQNCIHCKTCDIKDPTQNITWITPEGGGGPNYSNM